MMAQPKAPRTDDDDLRLIEVCVDATFTRYERVLMTMISTLDEPRVTDPTLALKRLCFLVETLAGFAVGAVVGATSRAMRYGFGDEVRGCVGRLLGRIIRDGSRTVVAREPTLPPRFLNDVDRPLLDTFGAWLLARLLHSVAETRTHLSAIHAEIAHTAPARLPEFASVLKRLTEDNAPALLFSDQLELGWQHYTAAISTRSPARPPEETGRAQELWPTWTRRLGGRAPQAVLSQDEVMSKGFLLQIA